MQFNIVQRTPILPLSVIKKSYTQSFDVLRECVETYLDNSEIKMLSLLSKDNQCAYIKYVRRASYRTAFAHGMVDEVRMSSKSSEKKDTSTVVSIRKNGMYLTPFLVFKSQGYEYYTSKGAKKRLEKNNFVEKLIYIMKDEESKSKEELIESLPEYSRSDIEETIQFLIESEFLLENNSLELEEGERKIDSLFVSNEKGESRFSVSISNKKLMELYSILSIFIDNSKVHGEKVAVSEFYEKYGEKFISLKNLMYDEKMMNLISQIRMKLDNNSELVKFINATCCMVKGEICEFKLKELKRFLSGRNSKAYADVFVNVYSFPDKEETFDLDTGHSLYQTGSTSRLFPSSGSENVEFSFYDDGLTYTSLKNKSIMQSKELLYDLDKIYIGVIEGKFATFIKTADGYERIKFKKKNLVDISYYPLPLQVILISSDYLNANVNLFNEWLLPANKFVEKRISIGNIIIRRKRWNISLITFLTRNFQNFKNKIEELVVQQEINQYVVFPMDDTEKLINLKDNQDLKFLYKESLKIELWVKEDLQLYSPFIYENERYSNQIIISPKVYQNLDQCNHCIEVSEKLPYNSEKFITIKLKHIWMNIWEIKENSLFYLNSLDIKYYFYVNYMNDGQDEFRLRIPIYSLVSFLKKLTNDYRYEVEPYMIESCRFSSITETELIQFYIEDSKRLSNVLDCQKCFKYGLENTITFLQFFCEGNIVMMLNILKPMINFNERVVHVSEFESLDCNQELLIMLSDIFRENNEKIPESEIRSLIHMSNNKIYGVNREIEMQVYKELYKRLNRIRYKNEFKYIT